MLLRWYFLRAIRIGKLVNLSSGGYLKTIIKILRIKNKFHLVAGISQLQLS